MRDAQAHGLAGRRVLVVEDEFFLADDLAQGLRERGADVIGPVPGLRRAVAIAASAPIDFAVIDLNLKGESGLPVADALADRHIPFIFTTGYDASMIPDRHRTVGRWEKPFDIQQLLAALAKPPGDRRPPPPQNWAVKRP